MKLVNGRHQISTVCMQAQFSDQIQSQKEMDILPLILYMDPFSPEKHIIRFQ